MVSRLLLALTFILFSNCITVSKDINALVAFRDGYSGDFPLDWDLENEDPCDNYEHFKGVICSEGDWPYLYVSELNLACLNLTNIPPTVVKFEQLEILNLDQNELTGTVPSFLSEIPKLKRLSLARNSFYGDVPGVVASTLETLDLSGNNLNGTIPGTLGDAHSLRELFLSQNNLTGTLPDGLAVSSTIETLELFNNSLVGTIPNSFGAIPTFRRLILARNNISGTLPLSLANSNYTHISLEFNSLTGQLSSALFSPHMERFYVGNNDFSGPLPTLPPNSKMQVFSAFSNRFAGEIGDSFTQARNLEQLYLNDNLLTGPLPVGFPTTLEILSLRFNNFSGTIPQEYTGLENLEALILSHNLLTGTIPPGIGMFKKLRQLELSYNRLSGTLPTELGNLRNLTGFYLQSNRFQGPLPSSYEKIARGSPDLEKMDLSFNRLTGPLLGSWIEQDPERFRPGFEVDLRENRWDCPLPGHCDLYPLGDGLCVPCLGQQTPARPPPAVLLQFIHVPDFHGQLEPTVRGNISIGGVSALGSYVEQKKFESRYTLFLLGGDTWGGSQPISYLHDDIPTARTLNVAQANVDTLGHLNFYKGIPYVQNLLPYIKWGINSANLNHSNLLPGVTEYDMFTFQGVKIAVIGISNDIEPLLPTGVSFQGINRGDPIQNALRVRDLAREAGANIIIANTRFGVIPASVNNPLVQPSGSLIDFASAVTGFDIIFGGNSDAQYAGMINGALVMQSKSNGLMYSEVDVIYYDGDVVDYKYHWYIPYTNLTNTGSDVVQKIEEILNEYRPNITDFYDRKIADTIGIFDWHNGVANAEHALGFLLTDAMWYPRRSRIDFAIVPSDLFTGSLPNADYIPQNETLVRDRSPWDIVIGDTIKSLPSNPQFFSKKVSGRAIWQAAAKSIQKATVPWGGFLHISGFLFTYDNTTNPGKIITMTYMYDNATAVRNHPRVYYNVLLPESLINHPDYSMFWPEEAVHEGDLQYAWASFIEEIYIAKNQTPLSPPFDFYYPERITIINNEPTPTLSLTPTQTISPGP